ncbi:unnamed protein product [Effrenium voratum]|nr:unnamed protein product [Effrenium voratum]
MPAAPIHHAIGHADWPRCRELLAGDGGPTLAAVRGRSGASALVQALRKAAPADVLELMLASSSAPAAAKARVRHQSAADVAEELNLDPALVERLRCLERSLPDSPGKVRCPTCQDEVATRSALQVLGERVEQGEEQNPLVRAFFARPSMKRLAQLPLHRAADCHNFRQEVSETMAVLQAVEKLVPGAEALHFLDLCCGSGLTSAALGAGAAGDRGGRDRVTAVDLRPARAMPHFAEAGLTNARYLCEDMMRPGFRAAVEAVIEEVGLPVVVLGMHCCGALSVIATQIFALPQCEAIVLCPCCSLRGLDLKRGLDLPNGFEGGDSYETWAAKLTALLPEAVCERWPDMLTPCNAMISAAAASAAAAASSARRLPKDGDGPPEAQVEALWLMAQLPGDQRFGDARRQEQLERVGGSDAPKSLDC